MTYLILQKLRYTILSDLDIRPVICYLLFTPSTDRI